MTAPQHVRIAITLDSGEVRIMLFLTFGRGTILPAYARWRDDDARTGWWVRAPDPAAIIDEVSRTFPPRDLDGNVLPQPTTWRVISAADVPTDRTFRGAWKDDGTKVVVEMKKAREIHRDNMRRARRPLLDQLDVEYQRADERGDDAGKRQIAARKQELRDVTAHPAIEAAPTPERLRAVWPDVLEQSEEKR